MPRTAFKVDLSRPPEAAEIKTHNRWHPDIPMVEMMKPGDEFRVEGRHLARGAAVPQRLAGQIPDPVRLHHDVVLDSYASERRERVDEVPVHVPRVRPVAHGCEQRLDEINAGLDRRDHAGFELACEAKVRMAGRLRDRRT